MSLWKWNDVELEVDIEDYDFLERYDDAFKKMDVEEKAIQKVGTSISILKDYCMLFYHLFDRIFGEGTGERLFNKKYNVRICEDCYDSFIRYCAEQNAEANRRRAAIMAKYAPQNREQRRNQQKKRRKTHYGKRS